MFLLNNIIVIEIDRIGKKSRNSGMVFHMTYRNRSLKNKGLIVSDLPPVSGGCTSNSMIDPSLTLGNEKRVV